MPFLLDANTFIEAKDGPYPFDICPAFWSFVEKENEAGRAFSIKPIGTELCAGNDQLSRWATHRKNLFVALDQPAHEAAKDVVQYVQANGFTPAAKAKFLKGADPFLIAYAKAHGHTIVTHELRDKTGNWAKVKIPNVAHEFGVPCVRVIDWLRTNGFVMR